MDADVLDPLERVFKRGCEVGNVDVVRACLASNPHLATTTFSGGDTGMHIVCRAGFVRCALALLAYSIPDSRNNAGNTALHCASGSGHVPCMDAIANKCLRRNVAADVNAGNGYGMTPLHYAVTARKLDAVEWLLSHPRIDPCRLNRDRETVLYCIARNWSDRRRGVHARTAAQRRRRRCVFKRVFAACADHINARNTFGRTCLHAACEYGNMDAFEMCMACPGIDTTILDNYGWAPAHVLGRLAWPSRWKHALQFPAFDLNVATAGGESLLSIAWKSGMSICNMIIASGRYDVNKHYPLDGTALMTTLMRRTVPGRYAYLLPRCSDATVIEAMLRLLRDSDLRHKDVHPLRWEASMRQRWGWEPSSLRAREQWSTSCATRMELCMKTHTARRNVVRALVVVSRRGFGSATLRAHDDATSETDADASNCSRNSR